MKLHLTWEKWYEMAESFYNKYGNLEVPSDFKTNDGITYSKNGKFNLGFWIKNQRYNCDPFSEHGQMLAKLGMRFEKKALTWDEAFEEAMRFYIENGHLMVPRTFKTNNGFNLGFWVSNQKKYYFSNILSLERVYSLESIGMVWNVSENKFNVVLLCDKNNIDVQKNRSILIHMSADELEFKLNLIEFLNSVKGMKIFIVSDDGKLNELFSINRINLESIYIDYLDEFFTKYYEEKSKIKMLKK